MVDTANIYVVLIGLYLAAMMLVGIIHAVRIRTAAEYLAAGRTVGFFGLWVRLWQPFAEPQPLSFLWARAMHLGSTEFSYGPPDIGYRNQFPYLFRNGYKPRYLHWISRYCVIHFLGGLPTTILTDSIQAVILATIVPHFYFGQTYWSAAGGYICSLIATIGASLLTGHAEDEAGSSGLFSGA